MSMQTISVPIQIPADQVSIEMTVNAVETQIENRLIDRAFLAKVGALMTPTLGLVNPRSGASMGAFFTTYTLTDALINKLGFNLDSRLAKVSAIFLSIAAGAGAQAYVYSSFNSLPIQTLTVAAFTITNALNADWK